MKKQPKKETESAVGHGKVRGAGEVAIPLWGEPETMLTPPQLRTLADTRAQVRTTLEHVDDTPIDTFSAAELMPLVYEQLRNLAGQYVRRERPSHTLQATALVHEAYAKVADLSGINWQGKTHFLAVCARMMRRLLVDYAKQRNATKRGGALQRISLSHLPVWQGRRGLSWDELLDLDRALAQLAMLDERQAKGVELRFFAGMSAEEIAAYLGVSVRSVERDWFHARAWLKRELSQSQK